MNNSTGQFVKITEEMASLYERKKGLRRCLFQRGEAQRMGICHWSAWQQGRTHTQPSPAHRAASRSEGVCRGHPHRPRKLCGHDLDGSTGAERTARLAGHETLPRQRNKRGLMEYYNDYVQCYMMLDCGGEIDFEIGDYYVERFATEEEKAKVVQSNQ